MKIVTVFGIRFAAPHDWEQKGSVVTLAEGERDTRAMNRCYVVGIWPQPRSEVAKKRRLVLRRGR